MKHPIFFSLFFAQNDSNVVVESLLAILILALNLSFCKGYSFCIIANFSMQFSKSSHFANVSRFRKAFFQRNNSNVVVVVFGMFLAFFQPQTEHFAKAMALAQQPVLSILSHFYLLSYFYFLSQILLDRNDEIDAFALYSGFALV